MKKISNMSSTRHITDFLLASLICIYYYMLLFQFLSFNLIIYSALINYVNLWFYLLHYPIIISKYTIIISKMRIIILEMIIDHFRMCKDHTLIFKIIMGGYAIFASAIKLIKSHVKCSKIVKILFLFPESDAAWKNNF